MTAPGSVLGIDPALDGAAVLLGPDRGAMGVWHWCARQRDNRRIWLLREWSHEGVVAESWHRTPGAMGFHIAIACAAMNGPIAMVAESAYVGRDPRASLRIARFGGLVVGGIQALHDEIPMNEALPGSWRAKLGLSAPNRDEAKKRSMYGVPLLVPGLSDAMAACDGFVDHVTDAAGVALVGLLGSAWEPGFSARVDPPRRARRPRSAPR